MASTNIYQLLNTEGSTDIRFPVIFIGWPNIVHIPSATDINGRVRKQTAELHFCSKSAAIKKMTRSGMKEYT